MRFLNAADAITAAVEIERRGHVFYKTVAEKTQDQGYKEFFLRMAEEEKKHEATFAAMLQRVGQPELPAGSSEQEYLDYLNVLVDAQNLFAPDQKTEFLDNPFKQAMRMEKDSLLFYMALENAVPESERKYIQACADEERKHIMALAKVMLDKGVI